MNPLIHFKQIILLFVVTVVFVCFGFLPQVQAVSPPPDGCYPNFTTAEGCDALSFLTAGSGNTGLGWRSLFLDSTGSFNTGVGGGALALNNGDSNTAVGAASLLLNTSGNLNTAIGTDALVHNDTGSENTANGAFALFKNASGGHNNAIGAYALSDNVDGRINNALGYAALASNVSGNGNTAIGDEALALSTTGNENVAVGDEAGNSIIDGDNSVALGAAAGTAIIHASNVIAIGANVAGEDVDNTTWIGNVYGVTTQSGTTAQVIVSDDGQLGTVASSERFKKDIAAMDKASEVILSLRPVTFHYKTDGKGTPQFGLIAEEVAKVNPALVLPDKEGKPYTVRYEAVNAMLLNEFLKEHRKVEQLEATVAAQQQQIKAVTTSLQKMRVQLETGKPASQMVDTAR